MMRNVSFDNCFKKKHSFYFVILSSLNIFFKLTYDLFYLSTNFIYNRLFKVSHQSIMCIYNKINVSFSFSLSALRQS